MQKARKESVPVVLKATFAASKNEKLKERLWPHAHSQLKEAWSAYILRRETENNVRAPVSGGGHQEANARQILIRRYTLIMIAHR